MQARSLFTALSALLIPLAAEAQAAPPAKAHAIPQESSRAIPQATPRGLSGGLPGDSSASLPPHVSKSMPRPSDKRRDAAPLSPGAQALVERAFADLGGRKPLDCHVHILGLGTGGSGVYASPALRSWLRPWSRLKAGAVLAASGVTDPARADQQYVERLLSLASDFPVPPRLAVLAFDCRHTPGGERDLERTEFRIPDGYVLDLARSHPDTFVPVASVHPRDPHALARLESLAAQGVRVIKWLPNAQGMDPSDPSFDPFYRAMARLGMALLCHTGHEASVASADQRLGNPLLLRRPLDLGVTVVMAHAGNRGSSEDLDHPGRRARNFELFLRMMDDPRYAGRLYGDISMLAQTARSTGDLKTLLERADLHPRLINGSDYPLPAVDILVQPRVLWLAGFLTERERRQLDEIRRANPLLFDFVLKRTLRHPKTGARFPASVFVEHPAFAWRDAPEFEATPAVTSASAPIPGGL
ncbi:amidohydrolase family protein [Fundidesulfovibrio agrisoli]|uniref:amidohydrolase family protein n=1 Tax=Fundidesulfovibrio agrisoli TaxID=2922717 RepID=UPI001FAE0504|nr:amidohydrolase family protein [Fundidesulfovibrio agrisoli]